MYRVIIVDDEEVVRIGLKSTFSWEKTGFTVTGLAENGVEALKLIREEAPDVVLTDIKMPEMDGLELIRQIHGLYPRIGIVILSAYNDFRYAQEAIRFRVKGYLLKPVKDSELEEIFLRLRNDIQEMEALQPGSRKYDEPVYELKRDMFLKDLLKGQIESSDNTGPTTKELHLQCLDGYVRIAACSIKTIAQPDLRHEVQRFAYNKAKEYWTKCNTPVVLYMDYVIVYMNSIGNISKSEALTCLQPFRNFIESEIETNLGEPSRLIVGVGNQYDDIRLISQSYGEAVYSYNYRYFMNRADVIFFQDISCLDHSGHVEQSIDEIVDNLIERVFLNNQNDITLKTHELFSRIEQKGGFTVYDIQMKFFETILAIYFKIKDRQLKISSLDRNEIYNTIKSIDTYDELKLWFERRLKTISNEIVEINSDNSNWIIRKAKDYVNSHYSKKLKLEEMAGILYINPSYFSAAFKKITGQHFIDYVTWVRIEKAKDLLLKSEFRIKEISQKVGYDDYAYFCRVFKKAVGITPLEFRTGGLAGKDVGMQL